MYSSKGTKALASKYSVQSKSSCYAERLISDGPKAHNDALCVHHFNAAVDKRCAVLPLPTLVREFSLRDK